MATTSVTGRSPTKPVFRHWRRHMRNAVGSLGITGIGLLSLLVFMLPLAYVFSTAFKLDSQMTTIGAPLWSATAATYNYQGKDYPLYK